MTFSKLLRFFNSFMTVFLSMDWFLYDRDLRHEQLTKLNSINTEARVLRCSVKVVFLTVSQSSQESIYVGVSY